jgi:hypothetical protein
MPVTSGHRLKHISEKVFRGKKSEILPNLSFRGIYVYIIYNLVYPNHPRWHTTSYRYSFLPVPLTPWGCGYSLFRPTGTPPGTQKEAEDVVLKQSCRADLSWVLVSEFQDIRSEPDYTYCFFEKTQQFIIA